MEKIKISVKSKADSVEGQGVGSAYIEQVALIKSSPLFDVVVNKRGKADIYHIHSINPSFYLGLRKKKNTVVYVHFLPDTLNGSIKLPRVIFWFFKRYVIKFYRKARHIVVVNPIFIPELEKIKIPKERISYIPNFVSKEKFHPILEEEKQVIADKYKIPTDKFIVLGAGQIQHRKGVLDFVDVANKNPDVNFIWAGGFSFGMITDGYKELKKVVENPPKNVFFLGIVPREEMNALYNIANLLFMPSYNELFPMCILEASNIGTPILLRDLDLYKDILFGNYLKGTSNDEFSNTIKELSGNKEYYDTAVKYSLNIGEYYSKENVLKLWEEYYTRVYNDDLERHKKKK